MHMEECKLRRQVIWISAHQGHLKAINSRAGCWKERLGLQVKKQNI